MVLHAKQRLLDQHTSLYVYQTSPVVLCIQNNVISTRITSFYGFQPSSVVLCIQNGDLRTKMACFYGSQTSPVVLSMQYSVISNRITSLYGFQPSSLFFACKTTTFGPAYKSLWVPALICGFYLQNSDFWTGITSLYEPQT